MGGVKRATKGVPRCRSPGNRLVHLGKQLSIRMIGTMCVKRRGTESWNAPGEGLEGGKKGGLRKNLWGVVCRRESEGTDTQIPSVGELKLAGSSARTWEKGKVARPPG